MSKLIGLPHFVLTELGPARLLGWDNDTWFVTTLNGKATLNATTFLSPIYKTIDEFQLAFPEYFL